MTDLLHIGLLGGLEELLDVLGDGRHAVVVEVVHRLDVQFVGVVATEVVRRLVRRHARDVHAQRQTAHLVDGDRELSDVLSSFGGNSWGWYRGQSLLCGLQSGLDERRHLGDAFVVHHLLCHDLQLLLLLLAKGSRSLRSV